MHEACIAKCFSQVFLKEGKRESALKGFIPEGHAIGMLSVGQAHINPLTLVQTKQNVS